MQFLYLKKMATYYLAAIFFVALDRFLKVLAFKFYQSQEVNLIDGILRFRFEPNYNIALSIPLHGLLLNILISILILGILFYSFILIKREKINFAGLLSIISFCAISNFYDRLRYGYVIDYFDVKWFSVFNLADSLIVIIIFLIIYLNIRQIKKTAY